MKCIIAGSRTASLANVIEAVYKCPFSEKITEVISGGARGADSYGELIAEEYNIPVKRFPAKWELYGKRAGMMRNLDMANYANSLIAVWDGTSSGTKNMIETALDKCLLVYVHRIDPEAPRRGLEDLFEPTDPQSP